MNTLVIEDSNSSGSGKVTVLLTTLEATLFVILHLVLIQRKVRLERLGTVTTSQLGQTAMLVVNMGLQLITKQK